ncbi:MAG: GTP 3',8-cyclase MoaA [Deltaproteobacteria bacterium]|nr:GTP 3',8-cyclase MoaA [Deltaproteobacteria bacterium]MBW2068232.1 GTP 3',8-cyclase MoaA [Deltaproteobacteria bacterium]
MAEVKTRLERTECLNRDSYGRIIDYLRISVTDRCNLRCIYCMPESGVPKLSHEEILTYEEILRFVRVAAGLGITKVRLTGGEPLIRKGFVDFCKRVVEIMGVGRVSLTTNGVLLAPFANQLYDAGIHRINVSLDTLKPDRFARITRRDLFHRVWNGIMEAHRCGFYPVKINVVAMKGINDDEIEDLAALTFEYPFHVRFIEFMPFSPEDKWTSHFISADEIYSRLRKLGKLLPTVSKNSNGPARYFQFLGAPGKIGIISPISHHFCATCNRLRLTADGMLRTCLFSVEEIDFKTILRTNEDDSFLAKQIIKALQNKPAKHSLNREIFKKCIGRPMVKIGG